MIFESSCCAEVVNSWIEEMLLAVLTKPSVIVMDNAAFHKKDTIRQLLEDGGHMLLPLPPYSPDFNPIEESFAVLKKRRIAVQPPQTIEEVIVSNFSLN